MCKCTTLLGTCALLSLIAAIAGAKPQEKAPLITGGGAAQNFNAGPTFPDTYTHFAFTAQATATGEVLPFPPFQVNAIDFPAKGQVELRNVLADDNSVTTSQLHGEVVCM